MKPRRALAALALLAGLVAPSRADEVMVFAAASLTDSLQAIGAAYEAQSTNRVRFNLAASSTLARQIEAGAPADLFFSADEAQMDRLAARGLIEPGTRRDVLGNALVVVAPADDAAPLRSAAELAGPGYARLALADPAAVPAGVYAREWLVKAGVWPAVKDRVVPTENVRGALAAVASGNVEAGVVYQTDAAASARVKIIYVVPAADGPEIRYPVALTREASAAGAARQFLDWLGRPAAAAVFRRAGFRVLTP